MKPTSRKLVRFIIAAIMALGFANNAIASQQVTRALDDLVWEQGGPGLDFALVWGDWEKDDYGMLVRINAGHATPRHSHTSDYHGVTVQGVWVHTHGESKHTKLAPGGYAFQSGKENHGDRCEGPQDCIILIHQHGVRDFIVESN